MFFLDYLRPSSALGISESVEREVNKTQEREEEEEAEEFVIMPEIEEKPVENGGGLQWMIGEETEDDVFPQKNGVAPPAAPSNGQGGLTIEERNVLMEKRRRLK